MIYNYTKYRRKQNNLSKAEYNKEVNKLLIDNYSYLHNKLIRKQSDEATFNDTYLKLTRLYNPEQDFVEQFEYYFKQLSFEYVRDDKCYNYAESKVEIYTDNILVTDNISLTDNEIKGTKNKSLVNKNSLINSLQQYALLEKEQNRKAKANKAN